jgi:hypothetical protein
MRRLVCVSLSSMALCSLGLCQSQRLKQDMHAVYDTLSFAYNKHDIDAVMALTTPDYKWTLIDGKALNRAEARAAIQDQFSKTQGGTWQINIKNVMGVNSVATAVVEYHFLGTMLDNSKKTYKADVTTTERQNWVRTKEGWRQSSDAVLAQHSSRSILKVTPNVDSNQNGNGGSSKG